MHPPERPEANSSPIQLAGKPELVFPFNNRLIGQIDALFYKR
jgi:hypothetical protein